jgi:site-specific recombinase XerD
MDQLTDNTEPHVRDRINELLDRYLSERGAGRNLSAYTLRNYRTDLSGFFDDLASRVVDPLEASRGDLRRYLARLLQDGIAPASVTRKVSTIRGYYKYLRAENVIENDPFYGVKGPQKPRRLPKFLAAEEVFRLIGAADGKEPPGLRDRALLELLYAAGLRVSELSGLDLTDVDVRDRVVRVRGKGNKERIGVFGEPAALTLGRSLKDGRL